MRLLSWRFALPLIAVVIGAMVALGILIPIYRHHQLERTIELLRAERIEVESHVVSDTIWMLWPIKRRVFAVRIHWPTQLTMKVADLIRCLPSKTVVTCTNVFGIERIRTGDRSPKLASFCEREALRRLYPGSVLEPRYELAFSLDTDSNTIRIPGLRIETPLSDGWTPQRYITAAPPRSAKEEPILDFGKTLKATTGPDGWILEISGQRILVDLDAQTVEIAGQQFRLSDQDLLARYTKEGKWVVGEQTKVTTAR